MTFILFKVRTDLQGLKVDIWGDGVEIGKKDQTRRSFCFLERTFVSNQSSDSLFSFAVFQCMLCYFDIIPC